MTYRWQVGLEQQHLQLSISQLSIGAGSICMADSLAGWLMHFQSAFGPFWVSSSARPRVVSPSSQIFQ